MGVYIRNGIIYLHDQVNGKQERLSTRQKATKQLVRWYERNFDTEFQKLFVRKYGNAQGITLAEYGSMVIELTKDGRTQASQKDLSTIFKKLCAFFGDMDIADIKPTHIMMWQSKCGLASKTIVNYRSCLNMIFEAAYNDELISRNPVRAAKAPRITPTKKSVFYTLEDIKKLLNACDGQKRNIIQVLFFTGMRAGELIGLKWEDIDFEKGLIYLRRNVRNAVEKNSLKTQDERIVPMFRQAKEALIDQQRFSKMKSEYVFVTQYGKRYNRSDKIRAQFIQICKDAGVEVGTLHDLRRSCNTFLKQEGFKPDFILDFMGHSQEYVNRKHYTGKILDDLDKINAISL